MGFTVGLDDKAAIQIGISYQNILQADNLTEAVLEFLFVEVKAELTGVDDGAPDPGSSFSLAA